MRPNSITTISAADASTDKSGGVIDATKLLYVSAQCISTGSSTGTVQLQFSNDQPKSAPVDPVTGLPVPTNWSNLGTAATITADSVTNVAPTQICANYLRAIYTHNNGSTGTITVNLNTQGF